MAFGSAGWRRPADRLSRHIKLCKFKEFVMISRCILRRAGVVGVVTLALSVGATDGVKASSIISNNFGPGDSYSTSGGHVIGVFGPGAPLFSWGEPFTPAGVSYTLDTIAIAATYFSRLNAMD